MPATPPEHHAGHRRLLRRLQTDHVDLYQLHFWDVNTPVDESLLALDDLIHAGKVRYVGISNVLA
jgi:aryl-alcohol dehydrogenase-like predicted oxidoreductase